MKKYLIAFLLTLAYYIGYNSLGFVFFDIVEQFLGLEYIYIVNPIVFIIVVTILFTVIKKSHKKTFFIDTSFLKIFLLILVLSIFFKLFKEPFLSIYEILGIESIPKVEKKDLVVIHQVFYILYFVLLVSIAEEIMFRGIILKKLIDDKNIIQPIIYSSFLFSLIHLDPYNLSYYSLSVILRTFAFGIIAAIIFIKTKNLIYPILFHIISNLLTYLFNTIFVYEYFMILEYLNFNYVYWLIVTASIIGIFFTLRKIR